MDASFEPVKPPEKPVKTSVKVIVLVVGILGLVSVCCGILVAAFYAFIPASAVSPEINISQMRLGGGIISALCLLPGIALLILGVCLWFFLWRKN